MSIPNHETVQEVFGEYSIIKTLKSRDLLPDLSIKSPFLTLQPEY